MRVLISEKLSEHKYKTPEGYLICTDAILARTGKQTYTRDELFGDGDNTEVNVDRPYDEVMNEKTIASFENKPVTFDHPEEDVNIGNYKSYAVGYVRDVRQGKVDGKDVILGNLVITDGDAINAIESGDHTDLSCGYDCDIKDDGNGNYAQNNIRGNHVALCKEGRAGMARIVDSKVKDTNLIEGKTYTTKSGNKLTINKIQAGYFDGTGKPWVKIEYSFVLTNGYKGTSECYAENFHKMLKDSKIDDSKIRDGNYIYEFYYNDIDNEDKRMMRKYNLEVVGKSGKGRGERNLAVKGSLENLKRYAKEWLGYDLHPDYLIPESQFAYDMYDSVKDDNLLGKRVRIRKRYSNLDGTIGTIFSYEGTNYDDEVEVERNGHIYKVDYEDIEFLDSKIEDASYTLTKKWDDKAEFAKIAKSYNLKTYGNDIIEGRPDNIEEFIHDYCKERFDRDKLRDSKVKDWTPEEVRQFKVERRGKGYGVYYKGQLVSKYDDYDEYEAQEELKRLRRYYYVDSRKEMKMSDAIKMLNVVSAYKKVKDADARKNSNGISYKFERGYWWAFSISNSNKLSTEDVEKLARQYNVSTVTYKNGALLKNYSTGTRYYQSYGVKGADKQNVIKFCEKLNPAAAPLKFEDSIKDADEWVIKNTGLAYEIWNNNKMVKKFPTKKLAIEWIRGRFPTDKITEA